MANSIQQTLNRLTDEVQEMIEPVAGRLQAQLQACLEPEINALVKKAEHKASKCRTFNEVLPIIEEFIQDFRAILENAEITISLNNRTFKVKGFID